MYSSVLQKQGVMPGIGAFWAIISILEDYMPKLSSQKEIEQYTGLSLDVCRKEGYPMTKIGNRWQSHTDLIDDFIKARVLKDMESQKCVNTL